MKITIQTKTKDYNDRIYTADGRDLSVSKDGSLFAFEGMGFEFKVKASDLNAALNALNAADPS